MSNLSSNYIVGSVEAPAVLVGELEPQATINVTIQSTGVVLKAHYVHDQILAASMWIIEHPLGKYPSVTIVDTANSIVVGDVNYISSSEIHVIFKSEFSGKAYLN